MQYVKVGKHFSNACDVFCSVPQGSVLGPLLFLLFINDIGCMFGDDVTVKLFADDLKMYVTVNNIKDCQVLQHCLNTLYDWTIKWQLNISIPKCAVLCLGNRNVSFTYNFNNLALPNVSVVRDLVVLIDSDL